MFLQVQPVTRTCRHCGTDALVAECEEDGRAFVLTTAHLEGRLRTFDDGPPPQEVPAFRAGLCDRCASQAAGLGPMDVVTAGLRQKTCPVCHSEMLS